jgi:hypothetical protein
MTAVYHPVKNGERMAEPMRDPPVQAIRLYPNNLIFRIGLALNAINP